MEEKILSTNSAAETKALGKKLGKKLRGGEVIEFLSDLGGGKTTFVSGLAEGFGSPDPVASPSFTISYVYSCPDSKQLHHFDFYRLNDAGIVADELAEVVGNPDAVVAVEWGDIVHDVLPDDRIIVSITAGSDSGRQFTVRYPRQYNYLFSK